MMLSFRSLWNSALENRLPVPKNSWRRRQTRKLRLEQLEGRRVFSGSALSVGNDTGNSGASDVAVEAAGNSYLTGNFRGTTDFDPANTHPGNTDILTALGIGDAFVAKYAPDNSLLWARRMGGTDPTLNDGGSKIAIDGGGNVYVTGSFLGTGDFGPVNLTSTGQRDGFVTKLNESGTIQWAKSWGTAETSDSGLGVGVDATGNVYAAGHRSGSGSTGFFTADGDDVLKFSPSGSPVWTKWVKTYSPFSGDMAVDAAGNVVLVAAFRYTVDFDPGSKTHNVSSGPSFAGFVLKLNTKGNFGWVSPFVSLSTSGFSVADSVALDGGNVIVGGAYRGSVDFNPGSGTTTLPTGGRGFITKLSSTGSLVWAKALEGGDYSVFVNGLAVDAAGSIYATGFFDGTVDLDPGAGTQTRTTAGGNDIFALKLDAAGNFVWGTTFGGTGNDNGQGIAVDTAGTVYLAGSYRGTVDFDPDPIGTHWLINPGTFSNLYLVKLKPAGSGLLAAARSPGAPTANSLTNTGLDPIVAGVRNTSLLNADSQFVDVVFSQLNEPLANNFLSAFPDERRWLHGPRLQRRK